MLTAKPYANQNDGRIGEQNWLPENFQIPEYFRVFSVSTTPRALPPTPLDDISDIFKHQFFHLLLDYFHLPRKCVFSNNLIYSSIETIDFCKCISPVVMGNKANYKKYMETDARKTLTWGRKVKIDCLTNKFSHLPATKTDFNRNRKWYCFEMSCFAKLKQDCNEWNL